jgi:HSP20 family protein
MALLERLEHDLEEMRRQLSGHFRRPSFTTALMEMEIHWSPSVDAYEQDGEFIVKADLPGVKKEDITVSVDGRVLTIGGIRQEEKENKEARYYTTECFTGVFSRSFALPEGVDADKIQAQYRDGVLEIRIPLSAAKTAKATIPIKG